MPVPDENGHLNCMTFGELNGMMTGKAGYVLGKFAWLRSIKEKVAFMWKLLGKDRTLGLKLYFKFAPFVTHRSKDLFGLL